VIRCGIEANDDGSTEAVVELLAVQIKLQSNSHQTNTQFFTGRMPFVSPNQKRQSTEGKISHIPYGLARPNLKGGIFQLCL